MSRRQPHLRPRVVLLAVFSAITLATGALFTIAERDRSGPTAGAPGSVRALPASLFTLRRAPGALGGLLSRARLEQELSSAYSEPTGARVCVSARVVGTSEVVFDRNGDRAAIPASTLKLLTGAAALEALGPDYRFTTRAVSTGPATDGIVDGPLYLIGGGDPLLSTPAYGRWEDERRRTIFRLTEAVPRTDVGDLVAALKAAGVRRVTGPVIADASFFDDQRTNPGWKDSYFVDLEIAPVTGLVINRSLRGWDGSSDLGIVADPVGNAAAVFRELLVQEGIAVDGSTRTGPVPPGATVLGSVRGAPLADVVEHMERGSDNFTAEYILKALGKEVRREGSFAAGAQVVAEVLSAKGVAVNGLVMADGSGLARANQVPCALLSDLLARTDASPGFAVLAARLGVSGESGTLRARYPQADLKGKVRGKTGYLDGAYNIAGLVRESDGRGGLSFAVLVNAADDDLAYELQVRVMQALLRYPAVTVPPAA